jgi:hypothetical protein
MCRVDGSANRINHVRGIRMPERGAGVTDMFDHFAKQ